MGLLRCGGRKAMLECEDEDVKSGTEWCWKDLTGASVQGLISAVYSGKKNGDSSQLCLLRDSQTQQCTFQKSPQIPRLSS